MSRRRSLLPAAALLALCLGAPAPAGAITNGDAATDGRYPAQGYLGVNTDGDPQIERACGGTLVGSRQFLTAARCVVNNQGIPLVESSFTVRLGAVDLTDAPADEYAVALNGNGIHEGYVKATGVNDVALFTLTRPADYEPTRVVDDDLDDALWAPGTLARVLGWGEFFQGGNTSDDLLTGDVTILPDADCTSGPFVCAAGTPDTGSKNPCMSDSGSPLLAPEGTFYALAGVFSGASCSTPAAPGRYARVGDGALNDWVHARIPAANFNFDHAPRAKEPVTLTSTSRHPEGAAYFKIFRWDLDGDGDFDASGESVTTTFLAPGKYVVGIEASKAGGDKATAYFAFNVGADPNAAPAGQVPPPATSPTPTALTPVAKPAGFLATIHAAKRPKVRRGRFNISVRFARTAPAGIAVVEAFRGKRKIGIARGRVRRGGTRRIRVKLTPTGRRLLTRSATKRLKLRVRVRVGRQVLRSKTLTVRR